MLKVRELFAKFDPNASIKITDDDLITSLLQDRDFPFLVSFPRTGSHWLRMLMELYFERPGLVRVFYFRDRKDFTCYHTHDEDLSVSGRENVIYLYRDPVDTVYSQLMYYKEDVADVARVDAWSDLYARHLKKWLFDERDSKKKTILTYEGLKNELSNEFGKIAAHLGVNLDEDRLAAVAEQVSKGSLKKKTAHDKQVVNLDPSYEDAREKFRVAMDRKIRERILETDNRLTICFR